MTVKEAHRAVTRAEEKVAEAERARDEALDQLDQALAERGWKRMLGGFDARLYQQLGGELVTLDEVLAFEMRAAA